MSQQFDPYEPLPDHLADTGPIRRVQEVAPWRRAVGFVSLIGAAGLTVATALLILRPNSAAPTPNVIEPTNAPATIENVVQPTSVPQTNPGDPTQVVPVVQNVAAPLNSEMIAQLMTTPIAAIDQVVGLEIPRNDFSAFTIVPDRPRSEVIQYTIQAGDTIFGIAERFGLKPETIAWSNDRAITEGLRTGKNLNILPVDGVYFTVSADTSIENIAKQYHVDAYSVIDSEYNDLFGDTPQTELPSGAKVVLPGGTAEQIAWTPPVQRVTGTSSNGRSGDKISFDIGDPGSCGLVDNPGGGGGWLKPLSGYQWVRGFSAVHSGVDLSAPTGTAITAANGGEVMFAGWSNWGYGYSVVIASGPYSEAYGHMSAVSARCGTYVQAGQVIGAVGMTGNASGPHLHFEIRYNDIPTDPTSTMPF